MWEQGEPYSLYPLDSVKWERNSHFTPWNTRVNIYSNIHSHTLSHLVRSKHLQSSSDQYKNENAQCRKDILQCTQCQIKTRLKFAIKIHIYGPILISLDSMHRSNTTAQQDPHHHHPKNYTE